MERYLGQRWISFSSLVALGCHLGFVGELMKSMRTVHWYFRHKDRYQGGCRHVPRTISFQQRHGQDQDETHEGVSSVLAVPRDTAANV